MRSIGGRADTPPEARTALSSAAPARTAPLQSAAAGPSPARAWASADACGLPCGDPAMAGWLARYESRNAASDASRARRSASSPAAALEAGVGLSGGSKSSRACPPCDGNSASNAGTSLAMERDSIPSVWDGTHRRKRRWGGGADPWLWPYLLRCRATYGSGQYLCTAAYSCAGHSPPPQLRTEGQNEQW